MDKEIFRSFRHYNYRVFTPGQFISLIGTWMQTVLLSWLVYRLTNSVYLLGWINFSSQIFSLILAPFAGVLVDRYDNRKILLITQTAATLQALVLGVLTLTGKITVGMIFLLAIFLGMVTSLDMPARQRLVVYLVERVDLPNAISLNSLMVNISRIVGPALGGVLVASFNEGVGFLLNAFSYLFVIASLLLLRVPANNFNNNSTGVWQQFLEGLRYLRSHPEIRRALGIIGFLSFLVMPYPVLLPEVSKKILGTGASGFGQLMAISGVGAMLGALAMAKRQKALGIEKFIYRGGFIFTLAVLGLSFVRSFYLSLLVVFLVGLGMMLTIVPVNTYIQTRVAEEMRGRVMSIYTMMFLGMAPIGSVLIGAVASHLGVMATMRLLGAVGLVGMIFFYWRYRGAD